MKKAAVLTCMLALVSLTALAAMEPKKVYTAKRINPHPPNIDSKMDDPAWENVKWGRDFTQREPHEGDPPTQKTAFKIMYDDKNLYVVIRAYDTEPDKVVRRMSRRDNYDGDWVEVQIDSYNDKRTAFCFGLTAAQASSAIW